MTNNKYMLITAAMSENPFSINHLVINSFLYTVFSDDS